MRTFEEILNSVRTGFVENFAIRDTYNLDSNKTFEEQFSPVSLESNLTYIVANQIFLHEGIIDEHKKEIESQIAAEYPFSISWYFNKALKFQLGDTLEFNEETYRFTYPVIDESKQIIKHVAVRQIVIDNLTKLKIYATKANKESLIEGGDKSKFEAFKAYITQIGAAGTHFEFVSSSPDNLKLNLTVYYNPQVLGFLGDRLSGSGKPVEESINGYLNNIRYGGAFNRTKCVDAVQLADGVVDVVLNNVYMNGNLANTQSFESPSGFFNAQEIKINYIPSYEN